MQNLLTDLLFKKDFILTESSGISVNMTDFVKITMLKYSDLYNSRVKYLTSRGAIFLGQGANRVVYDIGNNQVMKLNPYEEWIGKQNQTEVELQPCLKESGLFTLVVDYADDYSWIICEKADRIFKGKENQELISLLNQKLKFPETLKLTKITDFAAAMWFVNDEKIIDNTISYNISLDNERAQFLIGGTSEWFNNFHETIKRCGIMMDIQTANFGLKNNELVIIDYGFLNKLNENKTSLKKEKEERVFDIKKFRELTIASLEKPNTILLKQKLFINRAKLGNPIGKGQGRLVYDIGNNKVLKLSFNSFGISQARQEAYISHCTKNKNICLAKFYERGPGDTYVIMEKAASVFQNEKEYLDILARTLHLSGNEKIFHEHDFAYMLEVEQGVIISKETKELSEKLKLENNWYSSLLKIVKDCHLSPEDLHHKNWGISNNGVLFLIDYGMSTENDDQF